MSNSKKLINLFQSKGLLFPQTEKEVEEFELLNAINSESQLNLDAPEEILKQGIQKLEYLKNTNNESLNSKIEELKMVARNGSNLRQGIIDKMKSKHKKGDK